MNTFMLFLLFQERELQFSLFYSCFDSAFFFFWRVLSLLRAFFLSFSFSDSMPACMSHSSLQILFLLWSSYLCSYEFTLVSLIKIILPCLHDMNFMHSYEPIGGGPRQCTTWLAQIWGNQAKSMIVDNFPAPVSPGPPQCSCRGHAALGCSQPIVK